MVELIAFLVPVVLAVIVLITLWLILNLIQEQGSRKHPKRRSQPYRPKPLQPLQLDFSSPHPLKSKLNAMVGGNSGVMDRLLSMAVQSNPGRTKDWYYSKVIEDLIRDRR